MSVGMLTFAVRSAWKIPDLFMLFMSSRLVFPVQCQAIFVYYRGRQDGVSAVINDVEGAQLELMRSAGTGHPWYETSMTRYRSLGVLRNTQSNAVLVLKSSPKTC